MTDSKIYQMWPPKVKRRCSFCGTPEDKAKNLIASQITSHCICDKCIKQGKSLINETEITNK